MRFGDFLLACSLAPLLPVFLLPVSRAESKTRVGITSLRHIRRQLACKIRIHHGLRIENKLPEALERYRSARRNEAIRNRRGRSFPGRNASFESQPLHGFERCLANPARRRVDHPLQRHRVVRIAHQPQISEQILDFCAFVKAESAHHGVADVVPPQRLLHQPRLRVGPIQHRRSAVMRFGGILGSQKRLNLIRDEQRLVLAVGRFVVADQRPTLALGPQLLALAP